jgi:hypothetical protein
MCDPTLIISAVSNGLKMYSAIQEKKNKRAQQQRQNIIAKQNRINKETAENFRIRQVRKQTIAKGFEGALEGREARATAVASAESVTGSSVDKLMFDFLRQEGKYKNMLLNNLDAEVFASNQRKEAFVTQQEAQQTYVTDNNYLMPVATAGLNYSNDYFIWKEKQEQKEMYNNYFDKANG